MEKPPTGSQIYLNGKLKDTTSFFSRNFLIRNLKPGIYGVSVRKNSYNVWNEQITVSTTLVADASVFMLPGTINQNVILKYVATSGTATSTITAKKNPEYSEISVLFATSSLVTVEKPFSTSTIDFTDNFGTDYAPIMDNQLVFGRKMGRYTSSGSAMKIRPRNICAIHQTALTRFWSMTIRKFQRTSTFYPATVT